MNCILCLKIGNKYSSDYVNNLHKMVKRYIDLPFICFTDDRKNISQDIQCYDIEPIQTDKYWPAWSKLELLNRKELDVFEKKIFFDLDIIIHDDISALLECEDNFSLIYSKWKKGIFSMCYINSSIMIWKDAKYIYDYWQENRDFYISKYSGIDKFITFERLTYTHVPDIVYSYRFGDKPTDFFELDEKNRPDKMKYEDGVFQMRKEYSVALFHGRYDIVSFDREKHEILKYWYD